VVGNKSLQSAKINGLNYLQKEETECYRNNIHLHIRYIEIAYVISKTLYPNL